MIDQLVCEQAGAALEMRSSGEDATPTGAHTFRCMAALQLVEISGFSASLRLARRRLERIPAGVQLPISV
jgi:hypothetical protein